MIAILRDIVPGARISAGGGQIKHPGGIDMPRKGALNSARAAAVFGYNPRYDLRAGLEAYSATSVRCSPANDDTASRSGAGRATHLECVQARNTISSRPRERAQRRVPQQAAGFPH